jgi:hypothetical protein
MRAFLHAMGAWNEDAAVTVGHIASATGCPIPRPEGHGVDDLHRQRVTNTLDKAKRMGLVKRVRDYGKGPWHWYAPKEAS